jgi:hypothetical protein
MMEDGLVLVVDVRDYLVEPCLLGIIETSIVNAELSFQIRLIFFELGVAENKLQ